VLVERAVRAHFLGRITARMRAPFPCLSMLPGRLVSAAAAAAATVSRSLIPSLSARERTQQNDLVIWR